MPLRILLADENLVVQKLIEMTLTQENMKVTITDNGLSALDIAIKQCPDLILADYKMGGLDLISFLRKAKEKEVIADTPIILLVDSSETYDPVYLQSLGVEAFLKKPIDTQELKERIKSLNLLSEPVVEAVSEAPVQSELSQHFTSSADDSDMIADLLGWSIPEKELPDQSNPEIQTKEPDPVQVDPLASEDHLSSFEEQEGNSETSRITTEISKESSRDSDPLPFEKENPFSDEEQYSPEKGTLSASEEIVQDTEENDLLKTPVYGEAIIVPQHEDEILSTHQKPEIESPAFTFEESDPFAASLEESEVQGTKEEEEKVVAASLLLPTRSEESFTETQEPADETEDLDIGDELIRKTVRAVQETAERIVKEMLPGLVKSALSQEMITPIVERVAWELIPPLAEAEIKKEIKRLQPEKKDP